MLKWEKHQVLNKGAKKGHKYPTFYTNKVYFKKYFGTFLVRKKCAKIQKSYRLMCYKINLQSA